MTISRAINYSQQQWRCESCSTKGKEYGQKGNIHGIQG